MSAAEKELRNPETLDYSSEVEEILSDAETHMSVTDIRIELSYSENCIAADLNYAEEMETSIREALEDSVKPADRNGNIDGMLSRRMVIYDEHDRPTTISDTEETYRII